MHVGRLGAALAWTAACLAAAGCEKKEENRPPTPPTVRVAPVQQRDVPVFRQWIGTVDGDVNAQIRAQVTGYLLSQDYIEGAFVHKDDLLFKIDPRTFQAAVDLAQANLARDIVQQKYDDLAAARLKLLLTKAAATQDEYDIAKAAADAAAATVKADEAALDNVRLQLNYCTIRSPVDGVAGLAVAQVGDLVGPGSPVLAVVSSVDPVKVLFTISEQDYLLLGELRGDQASCIASGQGCDLELILSTGSVYPYRGKVSATQRQIDTQTGSLQMNGQFENPKHLLRPGQFARIRAQVSVNKGALLVPQRAVNDLQGTHQVTVVDANGLAQIRPVEVGDRTGSEWIITRGLGAGERVVVEGIQKAHAGQAVNAQPYQPATAPAAEATISPGGAATAPAPMSASNPTPVAAMRGADDIGGH